MATINTNLIRHRHIPQAMKSDILHSQEHLDPFPMDRLKRVDKPTNLITDNVQRIDLRNTAYGLAARGEYGAVVQRR